MDVKASVFIANYTIVIYSLLNLSRELGVVF